MTLGNEGVHSNVKAILDMEAACTRLSRTLIDQLPEVSTELRRVTTALDDRRSDLRSELCSLKERISAADEDENVDWEEQRLQEVEEEHDSIRRLIRQVGELGASYMEHERRTQHLATEHFLRAREFLHGAVADLKVYLSSNQDTAYETSVSHALSEPDELDDQDKQVLERYTAGDSYEINIALRRSEEDDVTLLRANRISRALSKLPPYHGIVYRGTSLSAEKLNEYEPGGLITERAFTSATVLAEAADLFTDDVLLIITSKNGKSITRFSRYEKEQEVLFDMGTQFRVANRDRVKGIWRIYLEEL